MKMIMEENKTQEVVVAVSGGFDPVHIGHLRMFQEAKRLGDKLIVILNGDEWLMRKKGRAFMPAEERAEIIREFRCVDGVFIYDSSEQSVSGALEILKPQIFANGGDRYLSNTPEQEICDKLGIKMVHNVGGGKIRSSSELLEEYNHEK